MENVKINWTLLATLILNSLLWAILLFPMGQSLRSSTGNTAPFNGTIETGTIGYYQLEETHVYSLTHQNVIDLSTSLMG